jgi:ketosteroid isomerase-like protein
MLSRMCGKGWLRVLKGLSDVHYENAEHFVDSESQTGISKWCLTGTGRDGKKLQVQGCDFYTFRAGKVVRKDSYWKLVYWKLVE